MASLLGFFYSPSKFTALVLVGHVNESQGKEFRSSHKSSVDIVAFALGPDVSHVDNVGDLSDIEGLELFFITIDLEGILDRRRDDGVGFGGQQDLDMAVDPPDPRRDSIAS